MCDECEVPYILRLCLSFGGRGGVQDKWLWQCDCKHKNASAHPVVMEQSK